VLGSHPFASQLQQAVGGRVLVHPRDCDDYPVGGASPKLVASPVGVQEAARVAKLIGDERERLVVRGGGTKSSRPPCADALFAVLDMSKCEGVLAYEPGDLTISVKAGTKLAHLQSVLARHGQFFPCDAAHAARATIGGTLAASANGALRQRYGSLRDNTLGMRVALSDGTVAFSGAKVVKSVAGYDAYKLFIGSLGTLGVIGEVTLKVSPLPGEQALVAIRFASARDAADAALDVARSPLFVLAMTLHDPAAGTRIRGLPRTPEERDWLLVIRCGGSRSAVRRQLDGAVAICERRRGRDFLETPHEAVARVWADIAELAAGDAYPSNGFVAARFTGLPADVPPLVDALRRAWPTCEITAHPAVGVVYAHVPADASTFSPSTIEAFWKACERSHWSVQFLSAPPALAAVARAPIPPSIPRGLNQKVKAALDPRGVFDPTRGAAGLL